MFDVRGAISVFIRVNPCPRKLGLWFVAVDIEIQNYKTPDYWLVDTPAMSRYILSLESNV